VGGFFISFLCFLPRYNNSVSLLPFWLQMYSGDRSPIEGEFQSNGDPFCLDVPFLMGERLPSPISNALGLLETGIVSRIGAAPPSSLLRTLSFFSRVECPIFG